MKRLLSFTLFFLALTFMVNSQDAVVSVSGHVTDDVTGAPIQNHLVLVSIMGGGVYQDFELYTNDVGFYGSDSILVASQGLARAGTFDCIGEEHAQEAYFNPGNNSFVFDFEICSDSIPQGDCENWFTYETNDNITFEFNGESLPFPANYWMWDFGDGATGNGQNGTHTYDPNTGDIFIVTLTTLHIIPGTVDSCIAFSTQEVLVGAGGGNCTADFDYTIDSVPTGAYVVQFADLSIGNPTFWMWDFGDGESSNDQNPEHIYEIQGAYYVCLTIFGDSMNNCYDTYCEEVVIGSGGGGDCENFFWYQPVNNTTFTFFGEAIPVPAYEYLWDFGDGTTGTGQQIDHAFSPNMGSVFFVTLTTIGWDASGDTCVAESMQEVWISNSGDCENWFWYDTDDNLTFEFFGESYPYSADLYSWDFGDGATGYGQNATHTYDPNTGEIFIVTLTTIQTIPGTVDTCFATSMQEVWVGGNSGGDCENIFWYESTGNFTYNFMGESFPFPADYYSWDFGDGTTATGQEVEHTFDPSLGNVFTVCLTTYSYEPNSDSCIATSCQDIELSGQMGQQIMGTVYMNGDQADFALVGLFGMENGGSFIYEFVMTEPETGTYFFDNVPEGEYYLLASLTPQSPEFTNYFPTYFGDALFWFDATLVSLGVSANPYDINLIEIGTYTAGPGNVGGSVTIGEGKGSPGNNITVVLMDEDENALTYTNSNEDGLFDFPNLGYGTYKLKVEMPGKISEVAILTIDNDNQSANIEFIVKSSSVVLSAKEGFERLASAGEIYPNPVSGDANLELNLTEAVNVTVSIYNQIGQVASTSTQSLDAGRQLIKLNTSNLPEGMYHVNILGENGGTISRKLVKTR